MNVQAHTIRRLVSVTGLAAVVAALAAPTALALPTTDEGDAVSSTQVALDLRSPDTRDLAAAQVMGGVDPAIATAMARHQRLQETGDLRSPDTQDLAAQLKGGGIDPAIATAIAAHQRLQVVGEPRLRRDGRLVSASRGLPVAASATPRETNWGVVAVMVAAIGFLFAGVGVRGRQGHGKRHGSVNPA